MISWQRKIDIHEKIKTFSYMYGAIKGTLKIKHIKTMLKVMSVSAEIH
jgi:hypothetical protein